MSSTTKRTVLVSGAGKGIGFELAKQYAARDDHMVIGTVRNMKEDAEALKAVKCKVVELDVTSNESCQGLPQRLENEGVKQVDLLINNAGVLKADNLQSPTVVEDALKQFNTNALGPLRTTIALKDMLLKASTFTSPARVVQISSRMGSIGDNSSGGYVGYRASKVSYFNICM